jgi:autotransporter-associated beta strand protein
MLRRAIALGALSIALSAQVVSAQSDPVGYNALLASFSAAGLPGPGTGVVVEQNEAPLNGSSPPAFVPDATASFLNRGVNINYENSGGTATSWHASNVAQFFYGNAGSGFFPAYGVSTVDLFNANIWTEAGSIAGNTLNIYTSSLPSSLPTNKPAVANFSWVGGFGTATYDNDALRRFDWLIDQSNLVAVVGVNNGSSTIPALMASGYNSIAVGLSNGQSSSGTVGSGEPGLDGQGRSKPDIVAPIFATSYATPMVAAEAATLVQVARYYPSLSAGTNAAVVKAILLAGTDKNPLPTWSHTPTQPLDTQYGAGQMNFNWGYQILSAGPQTAGTTSLAGSTGWSYSSLNPSNSAGNTQTYYFQVPSGQPFDLSALLTWQRTVTYHAGNPITFTPSLATIDLNLYYANGNFTLGSLVDSSSSSIDNVQYVFDRGLPAGEYALQVTRADAISGAWNYALAWQMQAVPYWIAANGSWNSAANWNNDLVAGGIGREAALFAPTPTGINVTLDAPQTVGLLTLGNTASTSTGYIISAGSGGSLTFSNSGSSSQLNVTSGSHVISAPVVLASNLIVAPASGAALGISGNISGTGALTDSGAGMLVLMGSNTYGGTTTISAGTLQLGPGGTLGPSPVADNSVLQVNRPDMFTLTNSVSGTGALTQLGTGTTTLIGTNGYSGGTSVNAGNLVFGTTSSIPGSGTVLITGSGALNVSGAYSNVTGWLNSGKINAASNGALALTATSNESINMAGYPQLALGAASPGTTYSGVLTPSTSTYLFGGGGGTLTVASNLTGANALVVNNLGPGAVALSGSNSYSGDTTVANGSLVILSPSSIPGGNLNVGSNLGAFGLSAAALVLSDTSSALGKDLSALPFSAGNLAGVDPSSVLPVLDSSSVNPALLASGGMTTVPEPSALLLMLAAGCCSLLYRVARRP